VLAAGVVVFLIGFAVVIPRGAAPGAVAHRNVTLGHSQLFKTRGYEGVQSNKARFVRVGVGLAMIVLGLLMIMIGS
jgi:hypothetical protein